MSVEFPPSLGPTAPLSPASPPIEAPAPAPDVAPASPGGLDVPDEFETGTTEAAAAPSNTAPREAAPTSLPSALQSIRGEDGFEVGPAARAGARALQTPQGRELAERVREDTAARTQTLGEAFGNRTITEHAGEFARGFRDGVRDTAGGVVQSAIAVGRFATDSEFRNNVIAGAGELRELIRTEEGRRALGELLGAGGDRLVAEISQNPARAAGYVAGSLATGGALTRAVSMVGRLGAVQRVAEQGRAFVSANRTPLIAGGVVTAGVATAAGGGQLAADVARTAAEAPFASTVVGGTLASGGGRLLQSALRENAREQVRQRTPQREPAPVEGSTWIFAP
ncbi:MAG: hypothetical protein SFW67_24335 [Myxococcaceae bacterium]|nr:hypothetical protein [Myxococcaceae bacterium]